MFFHAHPDDETTSTGGTMRRLADAGHRVVLVTATDGALGEMPEGFEMAGRTLAEVRSDELAVAATALGVHRRVWLGYGDSGMAGTPGNTDPASFARADVEQAAARLAMVLTEEHAEALTYYDPQGGYGHPDHVQVHVVGQRAAELAGVASRYEATIDRDTILELISAMPDTEGAPTPEEVRSWGLPAEEITTRVDVIAQLPAKRVAMQAHASQIGDFGMFLSMPPEQFTAVAGTEVYRRTGPPSPLFEA